MNEKNLSYQTRLFDALSHPNRLRIVYYLRGRVCCNGVMASELNIEVSNLSRHLKQLVQAGILTCWKDGLRTCFKVADERIFDLLDDAVSIASKEFSENHN
jgi:ArsR family transcriptional regulator, arsenate/arsenite/antimonite-responsive transcriptional repressor